MAVEILYVTASSLDARGSRVLVCESGAENWIWPEDGVDLVDVKLLGLTEADRADIDRFFAAQG